MRTEGSGDLTPLLSCLRLAAGSLLFPETPYSGLEWIINLVQTRRR